MADALLAFGVDGVRKNRHRPAKRPPDLPPHRRSPCAARTCGLPAIILFRGLRASGHDAAAPDLPAGRRKEALSAPKGSAPSTGSRKRQGRQLPTTRAFMRQRRLGSAAPDRAKAEPDGPRLCRETARQQQRAPPGRGLRLLRGSRQRPVPAEAARLFPGGFPLPAARLCGRARAPAAAGAAPVAFCFIYKCRKM